MPIVLIGGGSRSGKSRFALEYAQQHGRRLAFLATAQAFDDEMAARIRQHQAERDPAFTSLEEPLELAAVLRREHGFDVIVVDCLTLWVSNLLLSERPVPAAELIQAACASPARVVFVTNEVGCGIVPENALARRFRDLAGHLHQRVAAEAMEVYWMTFGIPTRLK
jgi:adenosylcobinamide kinase/adenosylcobinamide-phosphate guanylyltransferase